MTGNGKCPVHDCELLPSRLRPVNKTRMVCPDCTYELQQMFADSDEIRKRIIEEIAEEL